MKKKVIKILGNFMLIISIIFLILKVKKQNVTFSMYFTDEKYRYIFVGIISIYVLMMYVNANMYRWILQVIANKNIKKEEIFDMYLTSNLGKYIPGNIMQFVGRNILATQYNIKQVNIIISTLLEIIMTIISGIGVVLIFGHKDIIVAINYFYSIYPMIMIMGIFIAIVAISILIYLALIFRQKIISFFNQINMKKFRITVLICIIIIMINHIVSAGTYIMIIAGGFNLTLYSAFSIIGIYVAAWLVGFLIPGAPGGIGIKEAILVLLLNGIIPDNIVLGSIVLHRILNIIAEVIAFLLIKLKVYIKLVKKK